MATPSEGVIEADPLPNDVHLLPAPNLSGQKLTRVTEQLNEADDDNLSMFVCLDYPHCLVESLIYK